MKKSLLLTCLLCAALVLSACAPSRSTDGAATSAGSGSGRTGLAGIFSVFSSRRSFTLTPAEKLAAGTIKLDANGQTIDRAEAAKLLPLWQLLHQLYASTGAAPQEEAAVLDQIRSAMTPSQVAAIDGMQMSRADIFAALQQGQANVSTGSAGTGSAASRGSTGSTSNRGQGFFFGGGGGFGGGGFGGGGFRTGGGTGSGSTSTTTTQQTITSAQRAAAVTNSMTNALINQVMSLLQDKLSS